MYINNIIIKICVLFLKMYEEVFSKFFLLLLPLCVIIFLHWFIRNDY